VRGLTDGGYTDPGLCGAVPKEYSTCIPLPALWYRVDQFEFDITTTNTFTPLLATQLARILAFFGDAYLVRVLSANCHIRLEPEGNRHEPRERSTDI
jgi:hypothetical protein